MNNRFAVLLAILATLSPTHVDVRGQSIPEDVTIIVHHLEQVLGEERSRIVRSPQGTSVTSSLDYSDRGVRIQQASTLEISNNLSPIRFTAKGRGYRFVNVDADVAVRGNQVQIQNLGKQSTVNKPTRFFTTRGHSPLISREFLIRYWERHGRPNVITSLPDGGAITIEYRGNDSVTVGGKTLRLRRYSVDGVTWGREAVWLDEQNAFAAVVTRIHILPLEGIRADLRDALPVLQKSAVGDRLADLQVFRGKTRPVATGSFALVGATIIDGTDQAPISDAVVVIRNGRIAAAGSRSAVSVPDGVRVIRADGKTILPGLWDVHGHLSQIEWGPAYLAAGVTSARDVGGERAFLVALRDALNSGRGLGPRLVLAGLIDGAQDANSYGVITAATPEEGRARVDEYHNAGFAQIKVYSLISESVLRAVAARAHQHGMKVTGHVPATMSVTESVQAGMDQIEHVPPPRRRDPAIGQPLAELLRKHGTVSVPTLAWDELLGRAPDTDIHDFEPGFLAAPAPLAASYNSVRNNIDAGRAVEDMNRRSAMVKALHDAGVSILVGPDGGVPGHSVLRTLELLVAAGMPPAAAIKAATVESARFMGMDHDVGTIEAGKKADLLVIDGDPLVNISSIRRGRWVSVDGRLYETADLWRIAGFRERRGEQHQVRRDGTPRQ